MNTSVTRPPSALVVPAVVAAVLGAAAGLLWGLTVPGVRGLVTPEGDVLFRDGQLDNFFVATTAFAGISLAGGLLTAGFVFRGRLRDPSGVGVTLVAATIGVVLAVLLGQAVVNARFTGPAAAGLDFTAAPAIRLDGANLIAPANHPGGVVGELSAWVLVLVWPGAAAFWCTAVSLFGRLPDEA
ncbi:DUF2567 domain-containing protein [Tsukamurella sp. 1534]|uniref:DUF2567 domain-containing protein n=1 Tax=Tsukamurella sp. 1534 TaxID=1151061 RepID=UPI00030B9C28|nr:DUF2567 domain-containing protein [Tsukamurella sp. 1534]